MDKCARVYYYGTHKKKKRTKILSTKNITTKTYFSTLSDFVPSVPSSWVGIRLLPFLGLWGGGARAVLRGYRNWSIVNVGLNYKLSKLLYNNDINITHNQHLEDKTNCF